MSRGTHTGASERVVLEFTAPPEGGLELFDPIERHKLSFETGGPVEPTDADTGPFEFPVDRAVAIETDYLALDGHKGPYVRDESGETIEHVNGFEAVDLPEGTYSIEFPTDIKLYVRVQAAVAVGVDEERGTYVEFEEPTEVVIGARSRHEHPAATITTTSDPEDVMVAVSYLGSALKSTTPERSFPSLRGHPPLLELGEELSIPQALERPETGVTVEVPADLRYVCVVAPLAYYLGARVVPGGEPRLSTTDGWQYPLDGPAGFEETVARTLKQAFFLDCVTRTEGLYDFDLHERRAVEDHLDLPLAELYGAPFSDRLQAYLEVPYEAIEDHVPEWKLTTHLAPDAQNVELLPFLVDDLAVIRTPQTREVGAGDAGQAAAIGDFVRDGDFTRSASDSPDVETVRPEKTPSIEQAWIADGVAAEASKPTVEAFRNRLDREPADGDISITVVCNDSEMDEERTFVEDAYGSREELPFDVNVHRNLTTTELADVLTSSTDFLHYIGHIDEAGFECADGELDAGALESVAVDAFFLNACSSYQQGERLIEAGAIGGAVTRSDVVNSGAVVVGKTLARLLNYGFTLRSGITVASGESVIGSQYSVVGDGSLSIAQAPGGTPKLFDVERTGETFSLAFHCYPNTHAGMGAVTTTYIDGQNEFYLNSGVIDTFEFSACELEAFLALEENVPIRFEDDFYWDGQALRERL